MKQVKGNAYGKDHLYKHYTHINYSWLQIRTTYNPVMTLNGKPDLIIDTITYTRLPNCYEGYPSGIICGGPRFEFTLKIKNIGLAAISSPLFICNSRSNWDFENHYCSYCQRLNDNP